jgi:threonine dehydrogenase-like Zn-dependent dehydrogenase
MQALVFDLSLPRYALAKAFGKRLPSLYYGRASCLSLREVPEPALRGPAWVKLAVAATGFCGSDLSTILHKLSPSLSPFSSFPCVLGHEIFGRLAETGAEARAAGFREGDRVVINPALGCQVRGILPHCPACAGGRAGSCHRAGEAMGGLGPGLSLGYHRDLPGGFASSLIAHRQQLHRVPDGVPDRRAVLAEPLAIGLHAVLSRPPGPDDQVLIIGGGMIAYAVLAGLRLLGHRNQVTQLLALDYQAALARALGADEVVQLGDDLIARTVALTGARRHRPMLGRDVLTGGFPLVFDCIGAPESVRDALAVVRSGGALVLVGCAGLQRKLDLTPIWSKELSVVGCSFYAPEPSRGGQHTIDLALGLLAGDGARPLDELITHTFPLERFEEAVEANIDRARTRSVKTVLLPRSS